MSGGKRQTIKYTLKVGLKIIEERDQQFLLEKIIHTVEFKNRYKNSINWHCRNNCKIIRRVSQHLYADITDIFFEYIHSLDPDEIQQLDDDIKTNEWGVIYLK